MATGAKCIRGQVRGLWPGLAATTPRAVGWHRKLSQGGEPENTTTDLDRLCSQGIADSRTQLGRGGDRSCWLVVARSFIRRVNPARKSPVSREERGTRLPVMFHNQP